VQVIVALSQEPAAQSADDKQPTQRPVATKQRGVAPPHCAWVVQPPASFFSIGTTTKGPKSEAVQATNAVEMKNRYRNRNKLTPLK
jgi:hypothetical protein